MKVLVTGGLGYIGSHTCIALFEAGLTPIIYDNLANAHPRVLAQLAAITGEHFVFVEGDVADVEQLSAVFDAHEIAAVFHFAAYKAVGESTRQPLAYYQNNVAATTAMLGCMAAHGVSRVVFSSSATVYGDPRYLPIDEHHPLSATSPYGWTKVMVEQVLRDQCAADPEMLALPLRYFNPVGAHPSGLLGENPRGVPNNLMPFVAQTAVGKRPHVSVFGQDYDTPDGTGVRDYIHVMDLARGHVAAFTHHQQDHGFRPYNLGTGQGYSVLEMITAFSTACGHAVPYQFAPRRPGDIASCYADAGRAEAVLGWRAEFGIEAMVRDTWRWQSNYPNGMESNDE